LLTVDDNFDPLGLDLHGPTCFPPPPLRPQGIFHGGGLTRKQPAARSPQQTTLILPSALLFDAIFLPCSWLSLPCKYVSEVGRDKNQIFFAFRFKILSVTFHGLLNSAKNFNLSLATWKTR
jgi:hypothetical protein